MNTNISRLETIVDCDAIIALATNRKLKLERELGLKNIVRASKITSADGLDQRIEFAQADLDEINTFIASLPEGKEKEAQITKRIFIEGNLRVYNERIDDYGLIGLLEADLDADRIDGSLQRVLTFITEVETHKATLPAA